MMTSEPFIELSDFDFNTILKEDFHLDASDMHDLYNFSTSFINDIDKNLEFFEPYKAQVMYILVLFFYCSSHICNS